MEPPHKKARIDHFSSLPTDKAAAAAAVAAKLSQTLMRVPQTSFPAVRPSDITYLSFGEPETMNVPAERVGQIIGKGGMKIRELQEKAQVKIAIAKDNNVNEPHLREIKLTGSKEAIEKCKKLLKELFDEVKIREGGTPDRTIEIPMNVVGLVIGRGGETVRKIIEDTNCIVQVEKHENFAATGRTPPKPGFQNVYLSGAPEALDKAEKTVLELVSGAGARRRPPQYPYPGGFMPPYGMQHPYPSPYGVPPGPYVPGQTYPAPNPYHPGQMYSAPPMYNGQANPYGQAPQPYSPQGQPYNPQAPPGQVPYNPAQHAPPSAQTQVPPQGFGGMNPGAAPGQTAYNPGQPAYYTMPGTYAPNQNSFAGQQSALPNQIPGHMGAPQQQIPWQPNVESNQLPGQQSTALNNIGGMNQISGQGNSQQGQGGTIGQANQVSGQSSGQLNQFSATQTGHPNQT